MTFSMLIEWADRIDSRLGPISGRDADALAVLLRQTAKDREEQDLAVREAEAQLAALRQPIEGAETRSYEAGFRDAIALAAKLAEDRGEAKPGYEPMYEAQDEAICIATEIRQIPMPARNGE